MSEIMRRTSRVGRGHRPEGRGRPRGEGICTPARGEGGNYCTRHWAGVCANCYISGTVEIWRATQMPYCPSAVAASLQTVTLSLRQICELR